MNEVTLVDPHAEGATVLVSGGANVSSARTNALADVRRRRQAMADRVARLRLSRPTYPDSPELTAEQADDARARASSQARTIARD